MMHKLMYWLTGFLKCRIIDIDGEPYLERYYLATIFGKRIFIHRFMAGDPDRGLHDHPWQWATSFILAGGYNEMQKIGDMVTITKRRAPAINHFKGDAFHRIKLPKELSGKTWTMFIHGPRDRDWGFLIYTIGSPITFNPSHESDLGWILESAFITASTETERKQNMSWWKRPDAKTGNQIRKGE